MSNYAEWRAGTNFYQRRVDVGIVQNPVVTGTHPKITWQGADGVIYYVQRSPDLGPFQTIASNILGFAGTMSYTDTNAVSSAALTYTVWVCNNLLVMPRRASRRSS